jgi:hypothetical protein
MPDRYFKFYLAFDFGAKSGRAVRGHLRSGIFLTAFMCNARRRTDTDFSVTDRHQSVTIKGSVEDDFIDSSWVSALLFHVGEIIRRDTRYDKKRNTILGGCDCVVLHVRSLFCPECYRPAEERLRKSAKQRPAPRVVALDERQYHSGGHQA